MDCATPSVSHARADLQLFDESTTTERTTEARSAAPALLEASEYLLQQYGFALQQRDGDSDGDNDPRTVAPNETATVTIAVQVPRYGRESVRTSA
ncbi:MAG: hypothetical protein HC933_01560 [Pleurocapsa sp. SU_196_0]|nr:hypothetical protein [Pleurocapsa sp. SU_196_0]